MSNIAIDSSKNPPAITVDGIAWGPPSTLPPVPNWPGTATRVAAGDSVATIQSKLNTVTAGNSLVFPANSTFTFDGGTVHGKIGVTLWADGVVIINGAPGSGSGGAFDFSGLTGWTIRGKAPGQGFTLNGTLINASNASGFKVGNCQFSNIASNGFDGSAIRLGGANQGLVINNDFTNCAGNVLGMYNLDNITFDGNHFTACWQPFSVQSPTVANQSLGRNLVWRRNVFLKTQRACIEVGPASSGAEYFSGLIVDNNFFDDFDHKDGTDGGSMLPISLVGQAAVNTTITNNFIRRGSINAGYIAPAIEIAGSGDVSKNLLWNWAYSVLAYQSGWNVHNNTTFNDGSSPYFGYANNGSGTGTFSANTDLTSAPPVPPQPTRIVW